MRHLMRILENSYNKLNKLINTNNIFKVIQCFKNAIILLKKLNEFEEIVLRSRPYEVNKNDISTLYNHLILNLENSIGSKKILDHIREATRRLNEIPIDKNRVLKVGIVGEIYTVLENFTNFDIDEKLNNMGIEVHKSISSGTWFIENLFYRTFIKLQEMDAGEAAKPYINSFIGGHGRETIGNTVLYEQKGFDGVLHLRPFGCLPEVVALSILLEVQKEKNIPVLSLIIDEMTGEAGYETRLEAFVDLLRNRKQKALYREAF